MKKEIYKLLTIEEGLIISSEVLTYLSDKIKSEKELCLFYTAFKAKFSSKYLTVDMINEILYKSETKQNFYLVKNFKFKPRDFCKEFENYKSKFHLKTSPISLLVDDNEDTIFGIFYRSQNGAYCLEDDYEMINLDISNIKEDLFLFENMFVGASGIKTDKNFLVNQFILLKPSVSVMKNSFLSNIKPKILVFGSYSGEGVIMQNILDSESPNLSIVFTGDDVNLSSFTKNHKIIQSLVKSDIGIPLGRGKDVSNPFILDIFDNKIGFIDTDLFKNREMGLFFNGNSMESFLRSILSQNSLFPFSNSDLVLDEFPNIYIISQDFHPIIMDVDGVKFISVAPLKTNCYAVLDFNNDIHEIKYFKSVG